MSAELKSCPFCGGDADISEDSDRLGRAWTVFCVVCDGSTGLHVDAETAIVEWNRRAPPAPGAPGQEAAAVQAMAQETDRDWSKAQDWKGMDGATAFLLINRHSDGWGDVGAMMNAWLAANAATPAAVQAVGADPLFWYRPCGDNFYEGPFHTNSTEGKMLREEKPDAWHPLYTAAVGAWQDIATAPRHTEVLVWRADSGPFIAKLTTPDAVITPEEMEREAFDFPEDFEEWWSDAYGWQEGSEKPTHWQPLPEDPAALPPSGAGEKP